MNQSQSGTSDQTSNFFWLVGLFFGIAIVIWYLDSRYIVAPVFWVRVYQVEIIRYLAALWAPVAQLFHLPQPDFQQLAAIQQYMQHVKPEAVTWNKFAAINADLGRWTRYPVMIILGVLAFLAYFSGAAQFRHSYNMKLLREAGQEAWPQITPILSIDLVKESIDKGPWAMAKLPLDFCREHDLLSTKVVAMKKVWVLKQKPSYRLFALQLGPPWRGIEVLPIHIKALVVVFMARATGQRPVARQLLSQIAASAAGGKLDFTGVSDKLNSFKNHRIVQWLEKRHAYVTSFMATLLEIARSDGVLASSEFLWLKPVDRRMWYMLNSVGRATAVVEVAGAYAHWKAEKKMERALKTPFVKGAVDAMDESLQSILFVEESDQWRTSNAG